MPTTLGISCFYHDAAAALVRDGDIVAAAQEERFTRRKYDPSFPINSIRYVLEEAGISVNDLDSVVFYDKPLLGFDRLIESYLAVAPAGVGILADLYASLDIAEAPHPGDHSEITKLQRKGIVCSTSPRSRRQRILSVSVR